MAFNVEVALLEFLIIVICMLGGAVHVDVREGVSCECGYDR